MTEIINLITQNGIGVVCVGAMIYFQNTSLKNITTTLQEVCNTLIKVQDRLTDMEEKVDKIC